MGKFYGIHGNIHGFMKMSMELISVDSVTLVRNHRVVGCFRGNLRAGGRPCQSAPPFVVKTTNLFKMVAILVELMMALVGRVFLSSLL